MKNRNQDEKVNQGPLVLDLVLGIFIGIISTICLIRGEIILPNKGVFLYGAHARFTASLLLVFVLSPIVLKIYRRLKK